MNVRKARMSTDARVSNLIGRYTRRGRAGTSRPKIYHWAKYLKPTVKRLRPILIPFRFSIAMDRRDQNREQFPQKLKKAK